MKVLTIVALMIATLVFGDDKVDTKANANVKANAKVKVKGKNSFKWHQAQEGLTKASKMFAKAKAQHQQSVKMKQEAQARFQAIGQAIQKAKSKEKQQMLIAQRTKVEEQFKHSQQLETQSKTQIKKAKSLTAHCHHMEGEYYYDNQKYTEAFKKFETSKSVSTHKEIHKTHYFMGKVYEQKKQYKEAKHCYEQALKIKPNFKLASSALTSVKSILGIDVKVDLDLFGG